MKLFGAITVGMLATPLLGVATLPCTHAQDGGRPQKTLYLFLSSDTKGAPDAVWRGVDLVKESKGAIRIRPVLLFHDFTVLGQADDRSELFRAVKEMSRLGTLSIPLYDEEGLGLAERWKIRTVPTFVLVSAGRAHIAQGAGADLKSLLGCKE